MPRGGKDSSGKSYEEGYLDPRPHEVSHKYQVHLLSSIHKQSTTAEHFTTAERDLRGLSSLPLYELIGRHEMNWTVKRQRSNSPAFSAPCFLVGLENFQSSLSLRAEEESKQRGGQVVRIGESEEAEEGAEIGAE